MKKVFVIILNIMFGISIILPAISPTVVVQAIDSKEESALVEEKESQGEEQTILEEEQTILEEEQTILEEEQTSPEEEQTIPEESKSDLISGQVYETVKKPEAQIDAKSEEFVEDMEKEEFKEAYDSSIDSDFLVPKTDSNFEVALAKDNGEFIFVQGADTLDEAMEIANNQEVEISQKKSASSDNSETLIPSVLDSKGIAVYATSSMGRAIKYTNGSVDNSQITYLHDSESGVGSSNTSYYINHNYIEDVPIIAETQNAVKVMVNGYTGWAKKDTGTGTYDFTVVPINQVYNPSYFKVENGQLYHYISSDVTDKTATKGYTIAVSVAPSYLKTGTKYYSYDGKYFYTNLSTLISNYKSNTRANAINTSSAFYNYFQYLPFRSETSYTAAQLNSFITSNTTSTSKLRGIGETLINVQEKYGVNAAIILGTAINESGWGNSSIAQSKNNIFGLNAVDSDPLLAANQYKSVAACIEEFAKYWISKGYSDPQDSRYYGGFLGNKELGANVRYASDPYWGEKNAAHVFNIDKKSSGNNINNLSDYDYYQLGIYNKVTTLKLANGTVIYPVGSKITRYQETIGGSVILSSNNVVDSRGTQSYEVSPIRSSQILNGGAEFQGEFDWDVRGYVDSSAITKINQSSTPEQGIMYQTHIQLAGWESMKYNGESGGTEGLARRLEAIKIELLNYPGATVTYRTHVQLQGWQAWKSNGQLSGTEGKSLRLEAIQIATSGLPADMEIQYRVHVQNDGWQEWKYSNEVAGTSGRSLRLEAIQIKVVKKEVRVQYSTHVEKVGWQALKSDGQTSGTSGRSLRLEAIKINAINLPEGASIKYMTHIQNLGWEKQWKTANQLSGSEGKSLRLEAIKIKLEGATGYHVEYRVHVQYQGWGAWVRDGALAGTEGKALRLEAIEVKIVKN
ncbi:glucosaminidase domain-containing protein [Clostridium vincentii]|uniref:Putative endo-beta-N-acetylglucosaminidase n=1 Tax=Clostridium vincentii TaxID=52704 RepID=A0A2T0BGP9_9CLOT|nr:glucosaminidase domain-containing protein [Clostridium vincentii]PRR83044.1 putative endo-beta-N-acetylglucosaminidase precursor [Clostridium vincentii]